MVTYLGSVGAWFTKGEEIARNYNEIAKSIGLSKRQTLGLSQEFRGATALVMRMGGELGDITDMGQEFAEATGRQRLISADDVIRIEKISKGANLYASEAAKLYEAFDFMGISGEKTYKYIEDTFEISAKLGLNAQKVIKTLESNMKTMQGFSFREGVKGMMEMSKLAVKMRVDVGGMLQMADKFYEPDAAIEAAAQLQLMGGDIAAAFGDPFTIMYEARNKPEELAKRVAKMTENMVLFNEKSQEYEVLPEARQQLKFVGEQLGFSIDQMTEMARQSSKIKDIKMDVSGDIADEDTREALAGMAKIKGGVWTVDVLDSKTNKRMAVSIADLTKQQARDALDRNKDRAETTEKDLLYEIALHTQTFTETMDSIKNEMQYGIAADTDVYGVAMRGFLEDAVRSYETTTLELVQTVMDATDISSVLEDAFQVSGGHNVITDMIDNYLGSMDLAIRDAIDASTSTGKPIQAESILLDAKNLVLDALGVNDMVMGPGTGKALLYEKGAIGIGALKFNDADTLIAGTDLFAGVNPALTNISANANAGTKTQHNVNLTLNGDLTMNGAELLTPQQKEALGKIVAAKIVEQATDQTAYNGLKPSGGFVGQTS